MKGHDDSRSRMLLQDIKYFCCQELWTRGFFVSGESCDGDAQESPASVAGIARDSSARHIFPVTMFGWLSALEAGEKMLSKLFQIWLKMENGKYEIHFRWQHSRNADSGERWRSVKRERLSRFESKLSSWGNHGFRVWSWIKPPV